MAGPSGNRHAKCIAVETAIDREARDCVFKPTLNRRSLALAEKREAERRRGGAGTARGSGSLLDSVEYALQQKERAKRLQEARAAKEADEMRECTFAPEINRWTILSAADCISSPLHPLCCRGVHHHPDHDETLVPRMSGVSRHLELLALARKRRDEKRKVEDKVRRERETPLSL